MFTSEELNSKPHPLYSTKGRRHFAEREPGPPIVYRRHMHIVDKPNYPYADKNIQKIIENYPILKPKVERIHG